MVVVDPEGKMEERREHIVMFPFMAQGHIIPFLALALQIEQKWGYQYQISLVNTPLNINNLRPFLPPNSSIRLLEIPFNSSDHGLPPGAENTDILPYNLIFRLLQASASLKPAFTNLLSDLPDKPLCIIADIFFGWSADVAHDLGVFHAFFSGAGGFGLACYYSMWLNQPHRKTESVEFTMPDFPEAGRVHVTQLSPSLASADGTDPWSIFQQGNLPSWGNSDGILFNTVEELDKIGLNYFRRKLSLPVWAIGPILLSQGNRGPVEVGIGITPELCIDWLDTKPPNSVLYISFGSQSTISASQMMQLAKALDAAGNNLNFIWVVRPPLGFDINAEFKAEEWLPEGFAQRVQHRGLIVMKWAPQLEILSHKSTAAFLSHCGWNSVLESLCRAVPLMGWPMAAEQFYNVKFLEEQVGVCVEVARGTHFEVRSEDIVHKIELVMGDNERGKEMRRKACEAKEIIKDAVRDKEGLKGSSVKAMEDFLNAACLMKEKKTQSKLF